MNPSGIAIVGLACIYPEARNPGQLWENILAQRRAFRRMPDERLRPADYFSADPAAPDHTYSAEAAVIEGYEFDRVAFRVVGSTYRSADLAHWLAVDVASQALADAGFKDGAALPKETTGVVLGNTLTGEFSRAGLMRLRWPYVRRVLDSALDQKGWDREQRATLLERLEADYKKPFPGVGEETLAGGLSNTIAGRICNQFDLKGGGYTIDGACASSLLAVANACSALTAGDLDVALAGGVDLSLDPFEIVGFAKTGALAPELMRIYDARSAGFWPGEGCGFAVLMRHEDAIASRRHIYATIRGWGVSSDGAGGITRPEAEGQLHALRRAYHRAGYGPDSIGYFEGHGTGTNVGDATELKVISTARREARATAPAAIGSVKANIGHTKAAAGIAGLIKATLTVHEQTLPPTTGCERPHAELAGRNAALRILREPEPWPANQPRRAAVSAMGFGGVNSHVTLEAADSETRPMVSPRARALAASAQDAELFVLSADTAESLIAQIEKIAEFAARISRSELADVAAELAKQPVRGPFRAAVVATAPAELAGRLNTLRSCLLDGATRQLDVAHGIFFSSATTPPRIGFLFPGQAAPANLTGSIFKRRFAAARELYVEANFPEDSTGISTDVAQPAIATASAAALRVFASLGLEAGVAVGHSLGEITALHWAGAFDEAALLRITRERGRAMAELGSPTGAMAAIAAPACNVATLLDLGVSIVGENSPKQTVIAGQADAVAGVITQAQAAGLRATRLNVSHAFHTPLVAAATPVLAACLAREHFATPCRRVVSTVTGGALPASEDLPALLCRQVTSPVRFIDALCAASEHADLWIETGPGEILTGLAADILDTPAIATDAGGESLRGILKAVGAAFAFGAPVNVEALFADRITRSFNLDWKPKFFVNPCELAPVLDGGSASPRHAEVEIAEPAATPPPSGAVQAGSPLELFRQLVAERAELPLTAVSEESRLLGDLHLNSISVGQMVAEAARRLGLPPLIGITDFANQTVGHVASALAELAGKGASAMAEEKLRAPAGVDSWVCPFTFEWASTPAPAETRATGTLAQWQLFAPPDHPLAAGLRSALPQLAGAGVILCLPENATDAQIPDLLSAARAVLPLREGRFVLVQHGRGAGSFARTLHLEAPHLDTCVIDVPFTDSRAMEWITVEAKSVRGHRDVRYDAAGTRYELIMVPLVLETSSGPLPIGAQDVLLVTGGGKGIATECALSLARESGAALALFGRSRPESDPELAANLERFAGAGIRCRYFEVDVTDATAVRAAVRRASEELGTITAFIHAAGANVPQLLGSLDEAAFRRTLAPKVEGARHVLAAIDAERLKLFVTFGSIIGRAGLQGEADYAVANEWLTHLTAEFAAAHPRCRCLAAEWSVWSGVGMGARLGRIETLRQQGITPISPEAGVAILNSLLRRDLPAVSLVITGRFGQLPTLKLRQSELPFLRFLEHTRFFIPDVELIVDSTLSPVSDPYVDEHVYHGERLFPAVMGMEAMAQAAMALAGAKNPPSFENVELSRPVVVPRDGKTAIRVAALQREPGVVEVALRCEQTGFQADHFRATCRFVDGVEILRTTPPMDLTRLTSTRVPLDPTADLYDRLLFHTGRFRRVANYRLLRARECTAEITPLPGATWFARYLPQERMLGCAAVRDAAIHAVQACIPHARLLPIGVRRIVIGAVPCLSGASHDECLPELLLHAREVHRDGDTFEYDLALLDRTGAVLEQWEGLRLRKVEALPGNTPWPEALLGPYLERRIEELAPGTRVSVVCQRGDDGPGAVRHLLGHDTALLRRADGKPEASGGASVSVAHAQNLTMVAVDTSSTGCDMEPVTRRSAEQWRGLLGPERFRLAELLAIHDDLDTAATRVWTAIECLKKSGAMADAPLVLDSAHGDGWVVLQSGPRTLATCVTQIAGAPQQLVVGVLTESHARA